MNQLLKPDSGNKLVGIFAPHPDDELIGLAASIANYPARKNLFIVYTTNGAPLEKSWYPIAGCRGPDEYQKLRLHESRESAQFLGIPWENLIHFSFNDLSLHENLLPLEAMIAKTIQQYEFDLILAPAFEGGHPDHDATNLAASYALQRVSDRAQKCAGMEYALYTHIQGKETFNHFPDRIGVNARIITPDEKEVKRQAIKLHSSQQDDFMDRYLAAMDSEEIRALRKPGLAEVQFQFSKRTYYELKYHLPVQASVVMESLCAYINQHEKVRYIRNVS